VLQELDLLISIDSAPAHLAGALGKPVWTLLPSIDTDWRWQNGGDTTFWYPTMRLFRQSQIGNWRAVIAAMAEPIAKIAAASEE
jgi:ADP-heptose:LPS heptosyltransferase